jgi:plasmid stability protein
VATLTIRNLDERIKRELRKRAAIRGVSMEQEVRDTLADSIGSRRRRQSILAELEALAEPPLKPFDQKRLSDEMWDEGM